MAIRTPLSPDLGRNPHAPDVHLDTLIGVYLEFERHLDQLQREEAARRDVQHCREETGHDVKKNLKEE